MVPRFRGRNIETGEWVYGHLFYFNDVRHFISPKGTDVVGGYGGAPAKYRLENLVCFEIVPETVGQSTGLKDLKGVEIFEGDIIVWEYSEKPQEVFWDNSICGFSTKHYHLWRTVKKVKVIGNIYENPELLEPANEN